VNSQWGNVTNTVPGQQTYHLISPADFDVANVIYNPIAQQKFKISTTVNYASSSRDFGFMIGACDGFNDFYSLRFVPSQNRFSFDKTPHGSITSTTVADNDVPITLAPNTDYTVDIVVENSMVVVYINNVAALSCRIYKAQTTNWGIFTDHSDVTFKNILVTNP
jgi:beta-fructofuranosidase